MIRNRVEKLSKSIDLAFECVLLTYCCAKLIEQLLCSCGQCMIWPCIYCEIGVELAGYRLRIGFLGNAVSRFVRRNNARFKS